MSLFTPLPDCHIIVQDANGGSHQLPMFQRKVPGESKPRLYFKKGAYFSLRDKGGTSNPKLKWDEMDLAGVKWFSDDLGRIYVA